MKKQDIPKITDLSEYSNLNGWVEIDYHFGYVINKDGVVWDLMLNKQVPTTQGWVLLRNDTYESISFRRTYTKKRIHLLLKKYFPETK
jgi:hypothetical protein